MTQVFVTTYEVIGKFEATDDHYDAIKHARLLQCDFITDVGGVGFRPSHDGGLRSVMFETLPPGWRQIGMDKGKIEALPLKSTKIGKEMVAQIDALPKAPRATDLAARFGYNPKEFAIDGGTIYFPTELKITFPTKRIFLRLPRFTGDDFEPNEAHLRAIPESEFMAAIEAHNAEAKRQREGRAA